MYARCDGSVERYITPNTNIAARFVHLGQVTVVRVKKKEAAGWERFRTLVSHEDLLSFQRCGTGFLRAS